MEVRGCTDSQSIPPIDVALEQVLQKTRETKLQALLLRAQAGAMQKRQQVLQEPTQELQNQLKHLQDMQGWVSGDWVPVLIRPDQHTVSLETLVLCCESLISECPFLGF